MMFSLPTRRTAWAGLVALLVQNAALAHGLDTPETDTPTWGIGLIGIAKDKPYRNFDNKVEAWPLVTFENRWVRVFGPGADLKLGKTGPVAYALTATYMNDGYKPGDSSYLNGMAERKASFWLGGRATWSNDLANISAAWQSDASGHSKGQRFTLGAERRFSLGDVGLTPRLNAIWLDSNYVNYYYGVEAGEARIGRAAYHGSATVNTEVGLRLDYHPAPAHTTFLDIGTTMLGSQIKDSPLVNHNTIPEVRIGYMYRF